MKLVKDSNMAVSGGPESEQKDIKDVFISDNKLRMPALGSGSPKLISNENGQYFFNKGLAAELFSVGCTPNKTLLKKYVDYGKPGIWITGSMPAQYSHEYFYSSGGFSQAYCGCLPAVAESYNVKTMRNDVFNAIQRLAKNEDFAIALSGGIDSSLLLAVIEEAGWENHVTAYIADTPSGNDAYFAELAAKSAGVRYRKVKIDYSPSVDLDALSALANHHAGPFKMGALSMFKLAKSIVEDGINLMLHGIGGEMVSTGIAGEKWSKEYLKCLLGHRQYVDALKLAFCKASPLNSLSLLESIFSINRDNHSIKEKVFFNMVAGNIYNSARRIHCNCRAADLKAISPFYDESLLKYLLIDIPDRFYRKPIKLLARKAMEGIIDERVIWRTDDQGLRWRPREYVKANFETFRKFVGKSALVGKVEKRVTARFLRQISVAAFEEWF